MWRALAIKELREVSGIAAVALALGLALVVYEIQARPYSRVPWAYGQPVVPFVNDDFVVYFSFIAAAFSIALGFRQSLGEEFRGTYPFLLHRPMSRRAVMVTKLLTGGAVYLACSAVPILAYGVWAATPGTHASPFFWGMTDLSVSLQLTMLILYLGAFLSGVRPARWFGTRTLPLLGSVVPAVLVAIAQWFTQIGGFILLAATLGPLAVTICNVAVTRDY
jgi:hypothetical protein